MEGVHGQHRRRDLPQPGQVALEGRGEGVGEGGGLCVCGYVCVWMDNSESWVEICRERKGVGMDRSPVIFIHVYIPSPLPFVLPSLNLTRHSGPRKKARSASNALLRAKGAGPDRTSCGSGGDDGINMHVTYERLQKS